MIDFTLLTIFLGRFLLAFYFLKAGISNSINRHRVVGLLTAKKIPFPKIALFLVIAIQILGSLAVIFNLFILPAAIVLILFTLAANFLICNYWKMEGPQKKMASFVFYANFAVIGALLLITTMTP